MTALAGPLHLLALVLVISGIGKVLDPWPATGAMRDAGLPVPFRGRAVGGIALGAVEATVGVVGLAVPAWWAATLLGSFYAALAIFVIRLRARDGDAGCGCFGASSTPPGTAHVVLNVTAAVVAFATASLGVPDIVAVLDHGWGAAVPYVALLGIGAGLVLVAPALTAELTRSRSAPVRSFSATAGRSR